MGWFTKKTEFKDLPESSIDTVIASTEDSRIKIRGSPSAIVTVGSEDDYGARIRVGFLLDRKLFCYLSANNTVWGLRFASKLEDAREHGQRITIAGEYDVDDRALDVEFYDK